MLILLLCLPFVCADPLSCHPQAVDVVGQAGKPRGISGFVTHQTPVRIGTTERAELATEEFFSYSHFLEGLVILAKNEGYEKMET